LSLSGSARGSVVVVPCGAMVPCCGIDCVGAQPVALTRGHWRGRLSRWCRRRRRSLRGCRAGCHQSCQDQKKRSSLHGEQMLPRHGYTGGENRLAYSVYRPQDSFSAAAARRTASRAKTRQRRSLSHGER
jgi:hypothetical protein